MAGSPLLSQEELVAIRGAIGVALKQAGRSPALCAESATPVALISEDRVGDQARPDALRLQNTWAASCRVAIARALGIRLEIKPAAIESSSGPVIGAELDGCWNRTLEVGSRGGCALLSISGAWIEGLAAHLLGGPISDGTEERAPSAAALEVFCRAGEVIASSLASTFKKEHAVRISVLPETRQSEAVRRALFETDVLLVVTLNIEGPTTGRVRLIASPQLLATQRFASGARAVPPEVIGATLGDVPVCVSIQLGQARLSMSEVAALSPGQLITLEQAITEPVAIKCAGVVKAYGRVVLSRGAMAIEVVESKDAKESDSAAKKPDREMGTVTAEPGSLSS